MEIEILKFMFFLSITFNCFSSNECHKINITVMSSAIAGMIDILGVSHSMKFEILVASGNQQLKELSSQITRKTKSPLIVKFCINYDHILYVDSPTVILIDEHVLLDKFNQKVSVDFENSTQLGIVKRLTTTYVDTAWIVYDIGSDKNAFQNEIEINSFFQIFRSKNQRNNIVLKNYRFFSAKSCVPGWEIVNEFSGKTLMWERENFLQKYDRFYNCPLGVFASENTSIYYFSEVFICKKSSNGVRTFKGISGEMLNLFALKYEAVISEPKDLRPQRYDLIMITLPDLRGSLKVSSFFHRSQPIVFIYSTFLITKGHAYSSFEKLYLPFDDSTWICLVVVFIGSFTVIFVLYQLSPVIRNHVFGEGVNYPSLGVIQIFFGLGYIRLPEYNFARLLFMTFTIFCLVVRTGYQSKMFDFIVNEVRHPMPETVEELLSSDIEVISDEFGNIDASEM